MSQQKFASNVIEKCLTFGTSAERQALVNEMLGTTDENEPLQVFFYYLPAFFYMINRLSRPLPLLYVFIPSMNFYFLQFRHCCAVDSNPSKLMGTLVDSNASSFSLPPLQMIGWR